MDEKPPNPRGKTKKENRRIEGPSMKNLPNLGLWDRGGKPRSYESTLKPRASSTPTVQEGERSRPCIGLFVATVGNWMGEELDRGREREYRKTAVASQGRQVRKGSQKEREKSCRIAVGHQAVM